jgi:hypothetical protein
MTEHLMTALVDGRKKYYMMDQEDIMGKIVDG